MKRLLSNVLLLFILCIIFFAFRDKDFRESPQILSSEIKPAYWLLLYRKSNIEYLYLGKQGNIGESRLIRIFKVKTGVPNQTPTPLPKLLGKDYWLITNKESSEENPDTAPYFLTLDIPISEFEPYGPTPYLECSDPPSGEAKQCNWNIPGYFGLHGIGGNLDKLSDEDLGSSGCIRHRDSDITYLFNLLDPENQETSYYIEDI